jgi:hypothetical protein
MCQKVERFLAVGPGGVYAMAPPGSYAYWVRQATRRLRDSFFGPWRGYDADGLPNAAKDQYDRNYWTAVDDPEYGSVLQLKAGKQPAEAVDAILLGLSAWRIDCDHTVQIANLYALRMVLGSAAFNLRASSAMQLRPRESNGLKTVLHFGRDVATDKWRNVVSFDPRRVTADYDPSKPITSANNPAKQLTGPFEYAPGAALDATAEQLVGASLSGSRVRWTNRQVVLSDPFRHENCVKLEYDLYAAGGLDDPVTGNEFTRDRLEAELVLKDEPIPNNIFIDEIEVFEQ